MFPIDRRIFGVLLLGAALSGGAAAQGRQVAYVGQDNSNSAAYLFGWQGNTRASVVSNAGSTGAGVARSGSQRLLTLDTPYSSEVFGPDIDPCIGEQPLQRQDVLQLAVVTTSGTDNRGNSKIVEIGTLTTLSGCATGAVVPFGSPADEGFATRHLALTLRPPVTDLVPGVALAGPSEMARDPANPFIAADVLTLQAGSASFGASGNVVPAAFDADQWLMLSLPVGERAYTRLYVDRRTGAEVWLDVDRTAGVPTVAFARLMVKPESGAGFGNVRQASRMWQSGVATTSTSAFLIFLYQTGNGERVSRDLVGGTESRTPITWTFSGPDIQQTRQLGGAPALRTWKALANNGGRTTFVMEREDRLLPDGTVEPYIAPRVNFYTDTGAATPPPATR